MADNAAYVLAGPFCAVYDEVVVYSVHVFPGEWWQRAGADQ